MISVVLLSIFVILLISFYKFGSNPTRPSVLFSSGMLMMALIAFTLRKEWKLDIMQSDTVFLLIGGSIVAFLTDYYVSKKNALKIAEKPTYRKMSAFRLMIILIIQFFVVVLYLIEYFRNAGVVMMLQSFGEVNESIKNDDISIYIPWYINFPFHVFQGMGYIWAIMVPLNYLIIKPEKKIRILILLNYILAIIGSFSSGGRMPILNYITPLVFFYLLFSRSQNSKLQIRKYLRVGLLAFLFLYFFSELGTLMGRTERTESAFEIVAEYCGAEIKNLDDFVKHTPRLKTNHIADYTLHSIYDWLNSRFGTTPSAYDHKTIYPFSSINGYHLGNVYTCYANYYADFGLFGLIFVVIAIGISCLFYNKICKSDLLSSGIPNMWCFLFATSIARLFISFFHEQFFAFNLENWIRNMIVIYFILAFVYKSWNLNYFKKY